MYFWTDGFLNLLELVLKQFLKYFKFRLEYTENLSVCFKKSE